MTWNPRVGNKIEDRFTLQSMIDVGGFASVWKARDDLTGKTVALKLPDDSSHERSVVRTHFDKESQILSHLSRSVTPSYLNHLIEYNTRRGARYIALEHIAGDNLANVHSAATGTGRLRAETHPAVVVAKMTAFLHQNGIYHFDMKPENILCRTDETLALTDFNTSSRGGDADSMLFYASPYTPPELAPTELRDVEAGPWSDVYSAGKLIHYLLTGSTYDLDETPAEGISPQADGAECSQAVASVVSAATSRDPPDRPVDGAALLQQLQQAAGISSPSAYLISPQDNTSVEIRSEATVGRPDPSVPTPDVKLLDTEQHISERQFRIEWDGSQWVLYDHSLNGTYVNDGSGWTWILSEQGYQQHRSAGELDRTADRPHDAAVLSDGIKIAPVDPEYGYQLVFSTQEPSPD